MKNYYEGTLKYLKASDIHRNKKNEIEFNEKVVNITNEAIFYKNFFGVIIDENGTPPILDTEVPDVIAWLHDEGVTECSFQFLDSESLTRVEDSKKSSINKSKRKSLVKSLSDKNQI